MKSSNKLLSILVLLVVFAAGMAAAGPIAKIAAHLAPLSGEDREALIAFYDRQAEATVWWSEYYATTDWERAFRLGEQHGFEVAAYYLETYRPGAHLAASSSLSPSPSLP